MRADDVREAIRNLPDDQSILIEHEGMVYFIDKVDFGDGYQGVIFKTDGMADGFF